MGKKLRVCLFSNTGMGNSILNSLLNNKDVLVTSVFTKKFEGYYPYYNEIELYDLCNINGIECYSNLSVNSDKAINIMSEQNIDLILVASFTEIIKENIINNIPNKSIINFHPSLLPKYRGPSPVRWVLINGEKYTGVTVHFLTKEIDAGDIILQEKIKIYDKDDCGSLLRKVANLSGKMANKIIQIFLDNDYSKIIKQDINLGTYYGKPVGYDYINFDENIIKIVNKIRAFTPFPHAYFMYNNIKHRILKYDLLSMTKDEHKFTYNQSENILLLSKDGLLLKILFKKE